MEHAGITVVKVNLSNRQVVFDFKKIFKAIGKTLMVGIFYPSEPIEAIIDFVGSVSLKPEPSNKAYKLILSGLVNASKIRT